MVFGIVHAHKVKVCTNADNKEPDTKAPQPETYEVGDDLEDEPSFDMPLEAIWEYFGLDDVAEVDEARDCEAAWSN